MKAPRLSALAETLVEILRAATSPIPRAELAALCGATERQVRRAAGEAVRAGVPVLSRGEGFFLARTPADVAVAASLLRAGAISQLQRAAALSRTPVGVQARQMFLDLGAGA